MTLQASQYNADARTVDAAGSMRKLYLDALLEKVKASDGSDADLLGRIERLVNAELSTNP